MTIRSSPCDVVDLDVLLDGDEDSDLFRRAASHIESCSECQRRLTELSGDAEHWSIQREMLRPVPGDRPKSGLLCRYRSPESAPWRCQALDESGVKELLAAPSHPEMLGRLGRYEIERIIGTGGMGIVLKGFDSELNRPVAIKLLAPHLARVGAARQRFAREARAAAAVVHEHVVPIHNVESDHAVPFLVMQFIAGESLQARVEREGPLSVTQILRIGRQAAAGLAAAHAQGLVHRDVKPANILLENGVERAYLTDFGLARASDDANLTYTGVVAGTPHYMSPEQADGQPLDQRSDLFSLGSVLYFMATGHPPFRADRPMAVLKRTCHDPHRPAWQCNAEIPDALSDIIDRLLEKEPGSRLANAADLERALAAVLADVQQGKIGRRRKPRSRRRLAAIGLGGLAVAASALLIGSFLMRPGSNKSKQGGAVVPENLLSKGAILDNRLSEGDGTFPDVGTTGDGSARGPRSALQELNAADPSPASDAQAESASLAEMLDALEATPFPEAQFGIQASPSEVERGTKPEDGGSASIETAAQSTSAPTWPMTFRSATWTEVLDWYSTVAGLPLQADEVPDGTFNYVDAEQHSLDDITNILQPVLRTKGMLLKRQPQRIELIRLAGAEGGNILGISLPSHGELKAERESFLELKGHMDELIKRRESIPPDAADRQQQLAVIQAKTDSLMAECRAARKIMEVESREATMGADDAERLLDRLIAINLRSADCVPQHTLLRLQRERLVAKATGDEINTILDLWREGTANH